MKTIILAGGLGTRISEETADKPKPMVLIGDKPILWHIMNIYASQGFTEFVIASGYKGEVISQWVQTLREKWNICVLDTGLNTGTGSRIKKCIETFPSDRYFITYGDGLANVKLIDLIKTHERLDKLATVTAVRPPARFGVLELTGDEVERFGEKIQSSAGWINGGFFIVERGITSYIGKRGEESFESTTLPYLARSKELNAYRHFGFWKPMDTLREKIELEELSKSTIPPWLA